MCICICLHFWGLFKSGVVNHKVYLCLVLVETAKQVYGNQNHA